MVRWNKSRPAFDLPRGPAIGSPARGAPSIKLGATSDAIDIFGVAGKWALAPVMAEENVLPARVSRPPMGCLSGDG